MLNLRKAFSQFFHRGQKQVANAKVTPLSNSEYERLQKSPIFDATFYCTQIKPPEVPSNPLIHYLTCGTWCGLDPHPLFDTRYYLTQCPELQYQNVNPVVHYLEKGALQGKNPHPLFDSFFYINCYGDILPQNPLETFLWHGGPIAGRDPCPMFDSTYYKNRYPEAAEAGVNPVIHYLQIGAQKGYWPHPIFDPDYYLKICGALRSSKLNPLIDFVTKGALEGLQPSESFSYDFLDLNGLEKNKTIFIIGAGPQLADLSADQIEKISQFPTIGLNRTNFKFKLSYFLTGYVSEAYVAKNREPNLKVIAYRPKDYTPIVPGVITVRGIPTKGVGPLSRGFERPIPSLAMEYNAVITASHLALILGAKKIAFIGVEQNKYLYYYQFDEKIREEIIAGYEDLKVQNIVDPYYPYANYDDLIKIVRRTAKETVSESYYEIDSTPILKYVFQELRAAGVEIISTKQDSITTRAGAFVRPLTELLNTD